PAVSLATRRMVPSPPNTMRRSTSRASSDVVRQVDAFNLANSAVVLLLRTVRLAARMRVAACRTRRPTEIFSVLATRPTLRMDSPSFFNQHQEFLVPRWTDNGRLRDALPDPGGFAGDKRGELLEAPLVNGRGGDDPPAPVPRC